jgi:hypothetical protein
MAAIHLRDFIAPAITLLKTLGFIYQIKHDAESYRVEKHLDKAISTQTYGSNILYRQRLMESINKKWQENQREN